MGFNKGAGIVSEKKKKENCVPSPELRCWRRRWVCAGGEELNVLCGLKTEKLFEDPVSVILYCSRSMYVCKQISE